MVHRLVWKPIRDVIVYRILGVDDSPHRIALGVALAFFVAWTPTIGFQMIIAVALASLVGANRAVTIPIVWISNPLTAVPLYYFNWCVGHMLRYGSLEFDPTVRATLAKLMGHGGSLTAYLQGLLDASFWRELGALLARCGIDLWLGSVVLGLLLGGVSYPLCHWAVRAYRRIRHHEENPAPHGSADHSSTEAASNEPVKRASP